MCSKAERKELLKRDQLDLKYKEEVVARSFIEVVESEATPGGETFSGIGH